MVVDDGKCVSMFSSIHGVTRSLRYATTTLADTKPMIRPADVRRKRVILLSGRGKFHSMHYGFIHGFDQTHGVEITVFDRAEFRRTDDEFCSQNRLKM